jgi:hypothetical protein
MNGREKISHTQITKIELYMSVEEQKLGLKVVWVKLFFFLFNSLIFESSSPGWPFRMYVKIAPKSCHKLCIMLR